MMNMNIYESQNVEVLHAQSFQAVQGVWPYVKHWILKANDLAKEHTEATILAKILQGHWQLLMVRDAQGKILGAATVELQRFPVRTILQIVHLGSDDFDTMKLGIDELIKWALQHGASHIRLHGRKGWERKLADMGFGTKYYVLEKELWAEAVTKQSPMNPLYGCDPT